MNCYEKIEQELFDNGIILTNHSLPSCVKSVCVYAQKIIFIDMNQIDDNKKYNYIINHEKVHFDHPFSFYRISEHYSAEAIRKEKYVNRETIFNVVPLNQLIDFCKKNMSVCEISDEICVPEEVIIEGYKMYKELGLWPEGSDENACI